MLTVSTPNLQCYCCCLLHTTPYQNRWCWSYMSASAWYWSAFVCVLHICDDESFNTHGFILEISGFRWGVEIISLPKIENNLEEFFCSNSLPTFVLLNIQRLFDYAGYFGPVYNWLIDSYSFFHCFYSRCLLLLLFITVFRLISHRIVAPTQSIFNMKFPR